MKEQAIRLETAKQAKKKGFDWLVYDYYDAEICINLFDSTTPGVPTNFNNPYWEEECSDSWFSAPTQSLLQKWLREEYNIKVQIRRGVRGWYDLLYKNRMPEIGGTEYYATYEHALEVGLWEALKLIE